MVMISDVLREVAGHLVTGRQLEERWLLGLCLLYTSDAADEL